MKKFLLLVFGLLILLGCSQKEFEKANVSEKNNIKENFQTKITQSNPNLTSFDKEIIKIATIKNDISLCKQIRYYNHCKDIVAYENKLLKELKCDNLKYLKNLCYDKLNYKNLKCNKIYDSLLKKHCFQKKDFQKALKNNDKTYCSKLPRIKQDDCLKAFR